MMPDKGLKRVKTGPEGSAAEKLEGLPEGLASKQKEVDKQGKRAHPDANREVAEGNQGHSKQGYDQGEGAQEGARG